MREAGSPLPHTSSWHGAQLSKETTLPLYLKTLNFLIHDDKENNFYILESRRDDKCILN
jgi:hypothetical protein